MLTEIHWWKSNISRFQTPHTGNMFKLGHMVPTSNFLGTAIFLHWCNHNRIVIWFLFGCLVIYWAKQNFILQINENRNTTTTKYGYLLDELKTFLYLFFSFLSFHCITATVKKNILIFYRHTNLFSSNFNMGIALLYFFPKYVSI